MMFARGGSDESPSGCRGSAEARGGFELALESAEALELVDVVPRGDLGQRDSLGFRAAAGRLHDFGAAPRNVVEQGGRRVGHGDQDVASIVCRGDDGRRTRSESPERLFDMG